MQFKTIYIYIWSTRKKSGWDQNRQKAIQDCELIWSCCHSMCATKTKRIMRYERIQPAFYFLRLISHWLNGLPSTWNLYLKNMPPSGRGFPLLKFEDFLTSPPRDGLPRCRVAETRTLHRYFIQRIVKTSIYYFVELLRLFNL